MRIKQVFNWQVVVGIILIILSVIVYGFHYIIFRDMHHILIYLIGDIAFVFLEVLFVTLIIHRLLLNRDKQVFLNKLNMVIGVFFNEVGTELIKMLSVFDSTVSHINQKLVVTNEWSEKEFLTMYEDLIRYESVIHIKMGDLEDLKKYLIGKRKFLLNLLGNSNLLEHETFTTLLWSVFHLADEISRRDNINQLSEKDSQHLEGDVKRAYNLLIIEWLSYMKHLKKDYPYLFSLSMRINPFDSNASIEVK